MLRRILITATIILMVIGLAAFMSPAESAEKPPAADCYAEQRHRQWGGSQGDMCSSVPPGTPTDIGKHILQHRQHGQTQELHDGFGNTIGRATYRCVRGTWTDEPVLWGCAYVNDPKTPAVPATTPRRHKQGDARVGPAR